MSHQTRSVPYRFRYTVRWQRHSHAALTDFVHNLKSSRFTLHISLLYMLLAILVPGISMILNGHVFKGIVCGVLHLTLIGWIPAAIWAVASRSQDLAEKRHRETLAMLARQQR